MKKRPWTVFLFLFMFLYMATGAGWRVEASDGFDHKIEVEKMVFEWTLSADAIHVRLAAETEGWVGIGFNPSKRMKDANFILGYVKNGKVKVTDHHGTTERQHVKDKKLGGEKNVSDVAGKEENGVTEIRFTIPLDSGDPKDSPIWTDKPNTILLAHGSGRDSFRTKHVFKTALTVDLGSGEFSSVK